MGYNAQERERGVSQCQAQQASSDAAKEYIM